PYDVRCKLVLTYHPCGSRCERVRGCDKWAMLVAMKRLRSLLRRAFLVLDIATRRDLQRQRLARKFLESLIFLLVKACGEEHADIPRANSNVRYEIRRVAGKYRLRSFGDFLIAADFVRDKHRRLGEAFALHVD